MIVRAMLKRKTDPCTPTKVYRRLYPVFKPLIYNFLKKRYQVTAHIPEEVRNLSPPYIVMGNHVNKWDPFLVSGSLGQPVSFIASDALFRSWFPGSIIKYLGAIPKAKFRSDTQAIKRFMNVKKCGGVLGVFPEGHDNWGGRTLPIPESTGKLMRLLKLPVVIAKNQGGHLCRPRWMRKRVPGSEKITFSLLYTQEDCKTKSPQELLEGLEQALAYDEWQNFRDKKRPFPADNRAENIQRILFTCPSCENYGTIKPSLHQAQCQTCGLEIKINPFGYIDSEECPFEDIGQWDGWQQKALQTRIKEESLEFSDSQVTLESGGMNRPLKPLTGEGILTFTNEALIWRGSIELIFPHKGIDGLTVQVSGKLEFYFENNLYRVTFNNPLSAPYKWLSALNYKSLLLEKEQ